MAHVFTVDQKPLLAILSSMQPICTKRSTIATTSYILFNISHKELVLKSTDLEISLQCSYLLEKTNLSEPRSFLVLGKRIFDLVKELDGEIEFTLKKEQLLVKSGDVHLSLNIKDAQEFPPFPERIENLMHLDAPFLLDMFNKVGFLIPQNNANPALNGLLLELTKDQMKMTTTDGHCLAQVRTSRYTLDEDKTWLLPRRAIFEVKKILESAHDNAVFLGVCGNQLVLSGETFNFFTKLLGDQFPHYAGILEKEGFSGALVDRSHLVKTLRRSACLLSGQFIATQFNFSSDILNVSMQNQEVGKLEEKVPLTDFSGAYVDIRFYAPYVLNGLHAFSDDMLTFYLKTPDRPIIFESTYNESSMTYLVMPVSPTASA